MSRVSELISAKIQSLVTLQFDGGGDRESAKRWVAVEMASYLRSPEMQRAMVEERIGELKPIVASGWKSAGCTPEEYDKLCKTYAAYRTILEHLK